jgi:hypothetical protein
VILRRSNGEAYQVSSAGLRAEILGGETFNCLTTHYLVWDQMSYGDVICRAARDADHHSVLPQRRPARVRRTLTAACASDREILLTSDRENSPPPDRHVAVARVAKADSIDEQEDARFGECRGDELPEHLATGDGRAKYLAEARRHLERQRAQQARPIPASCPQRLRESKRRLEEELEMERRANAAYEGCR